MRGFSWTWDFQNMFIAGFGRTRGRLFCPKLVFERKSQKPEGTRVAKGRVSKLVFKSKSAI